MKPLSSSMMIFVMMGMWVPIVRAEEVTVTTYYPSPRGVYEEMRVTDHVGIAAASSPPGALGIGGDFVNPTGTTCPIGSTPEDVDGDGTVPENGECRKWAFLATPTSFAVGESSTANGIKSIVLGGGSAGGNGAIALGGILTSAGGLRSIALGSNASAEADDAIAIGSDVRASAANNIAIGKGVSMTGTESIWNKTASSLMIGFNSNRPSLFVGPGTGVGTVGPVGIGTITPTAQLHVVQETSAAIFPLIVEDEINDTTPFAISQIGNVGIGTATPGDMKLRIRADGGSAPGGILRLEESDGTQLLKITNTGVFDMGAPGLRVGGDTAPLINGTAGVTTRFTSPPTMHFAAFNNLTPMFTVNGTGDGFFAG